MKSLPKNLPRIGIAHNLPQDLRSTATPTFNAIQYDTLNPLPFQEGKTFYDTTWKTLATYIDSDITLQHGQEEHQFVFNNSGVDIEDGQAVYATGIGYTSTGVITQTIALAKADRAQTANVIGVATTYIFNNAYGHITKRGYINNIDTSTFGIAGNILYLSDSLSGHLTTIKPILPSISIAVGMLVINSTTSGRIHVTGPSYGDLIEQGTLKSRQNPGISSETPLSANTISIDYINRILTIVPPLGFFFFYVLVGEEIVKFEKTGNVSFPAFTDTAGMWYFYFDNLGNPISTQIAWTGFDTIAPIYRILWNPTLVSSAKSTAELLETHENTISAETRAWFHKYGAIWFSGFDITSNVISSGAPNTDGRNTVIGLSTGKNYDDNLYYTISNTTSTGLWKQDLGQSNPALLTSSNSGLFKIRTQDSSGRSVMLPATRYPFPWDTTTNRPEYITETGVRVLVPQNYYNVIFIYSYQDPRHGEAVRSISANVAHSTLDSAQAYTWANIQALYAILNDNEVRPLYKLIYEYKSAYPVQCKYSVLRVVNDIRKVVTAQVTNVAGTMPATSVTVVPVGGIVDTNVQSVLAALDLRIAALEP